MIIIIITLKYYYYQGSISLLITRCSEIDIHVYRVSHHYTSWDKRESIKILYHFEIIYNARSACYMKTFRVLLLIELLRFIPRKRNFFTYVHAAKHFLMKEVGNNKM